MPATLHTKDKADVTYEIIYMNAGVGSVGKLEGGGYMHIGGIPIKTKKELTDVIPPGKERDEALEWFNNRGKKPEVPTKMVVIQPNGDLLFDDGSEVTSHSDIINFVPPGALQEYALKWLTEKQNKSQVATLKEASRVRRTVQEIRKEVIEQTDEETPAEE